MTRDKNKLSDLDQPYFPRSTPEGLFVQNLVPRFLLNRSTSLLNSTEFES